MAGHFTLNLTLTNLRYTADLGVPGTQKFNSTQSMMKYYVSLTELRLASFAWLAPLVLPIPEWQTQEFFSLTDGLSAQRQQHRPHLYRMQSDGI